MRPSLQTVLCTVVVLLVAPASLAAPVTRVEQAHYTEPARGHPDLFAVCVQPDNRGCVEFGVGPKDRKVLIEVVDDTGMGPYFMLRQEIEGSVDDRSFCGSTNGFVPITPNARITVYIYAATSTSAPNCTGLGTSGTVTATFRSR